MVSKSKLTFLSFMLAAVSAIAMAGGEAQAGLTDIAMDAGKASWQGATRQLHIIGQEGSNFFSGIGKVFKGQAIKGLAQCATSLINGTWATLSNANTAYMDFADQHRGTDIVLQAAVIAGTYTYLGPVAAFFEAMDAYKGDNAAKLLMHGVPLRILGGVQNKLLQVGIENITPGLLTAYNSANGTFFNSSAAYFNSLQTNVTATVLEMMHMAPAPQLSKVAHMVSKIRVPITVPGKSLFNFLTGTERNISSIIKDRISPSNMTRYL